MHVQNARPRCGLQTLIEHQLTRSSSGGTSPDLLGHAQASGSEEEQVRVGVGGQGRGAPQSQAKAATAEWPHAVKAANHSGPGAADRRGRAHDDGCGSAGQRDVLAYEPEAWRARGSAKEAEAAATSWAATGLHGEAEAASAAEGHGRGPSATICGGGGHGGGRGGRAAEAPE